MGWFWKGLLYLIIFLLVVRFEISASVYDVEDNRLKLIFPAFLESPVFWIDIQGGGPTEWGYQSPFADDYEWQLQLGPDEEAQEAQPE